VSRGLEKGLRSPCVWCSGETFVTPSRDVFLCSIFWGRFPSKLHFLDADLLRKSGPASCCQVPETLAQGGFENMATPVLVSCRYQLQKIFRLARFQHCFSFLLPGVVCGNVLSSPQRMMSWNNFISCFGPKPTCYSYRLLQMAIIFLV